jgi:hypothetical protein
MNPQKTNRCSICYAVIPHDQKLCPICNSYYPCIKCENKTKDQCMCRKWKKWFGLQWEKFHKTTPKYKISQIDNKNPPFDNGG